VPKKFNTICPWGWGWDPPHPPPDATPTFEAREDLLEGMVAAVAPVGWSEMGATTFGIKTLSIMTLGNTILKDECFYAECNNFTIIMLKGQCNETYNDFSYNENTYNT